MFNRWICSTINLTSFIQVRHTTHQGQLHKHWVPKNSVNNIYTYDSGIITTNQTKSDNEVILNYYWRYRVCLFLVRQPSVDHGFLVHEVSRSHTTTNHSHQDSSGRVISSLQRSLTTHNTHNRQTSMSLVGQAQEASGQRPTP